MKRHYVAAIFLGVCLGLPAIAAENNAVVAAAAGAQGTSAGKESKKTLAKKQPGAEKRAKVAQVEKSKSGENGLLKTRRMRGYGN